jgi:hypothetical protein
MDLAANLEKNGCATSYVNEALIGLAQLLQGEMVMKFC